MYAALRSRSGFTLIELLIVVAIVGILAVIAILSIGMGITTAHNAGAKSDISEAAKTIESFKNDELSNGGIVSNSGLADDTLTDKTGSLPKLFTGISAPSGSPPTYGLPITTSQGSAYKYSYTAPPPTATPIQQLLPAGSSYTLSTTLKGMNGVGDSYFYIKDGGTGSSSLTDPVPYYPLFVTLSGTVTLPATTVPQPLTFTERPTGITPGPMLTQEVTPDTGGKFTIRDIPAGTYSFGIKGLKWLRKSQPIDATRGDLSGIAVTLPGGDANNDNTVDDADYNIWHASKGLVSGDPNFDSRADFDCSGKIDTTDYLSMGKSYKTTGDPL